MGVSLVVGTRPFEVGAASFFTSFFSTVFVRLEDEDWGSRFPAVMNELYMGTLPAARVGDALSELETIRRELAAFAPSDVVWDYEHRERRPPWGGECSDDITNLARYFVTSDGKDLFEVLAAALALASSKRENVVVQ